MDKPRAFLTLDALRGLAAIIVVEYHTGLLFGGHYAQRAYLAVDFFFMLSGFVLTFAYQGKLDKGWSGWEFFKARIARLYPLYALGLLLGVAFAVLQYRFGSGPTITLSSKETALLFALAVFMLPAPPMYRGGWPAAFPLNVPSWSLFFEMLANIFHALLLRRRGWRFLLGTVLVTGAWLAYCATRADTVNFGVDRDQIASGIARVLFSYSMGSLLYLAWSKGKLRLKLPAIVVALLLFAALAAPAGHLPPLYVDMGIVGLFFPALLWVSASSQPPAALYKVCHQLGIASYAIYVLHVPIYGLFVQVWKKATGHSIFTAAPWGGIAYLVLVIGFSLLIDRVYDEPARAWLRGKLTGAKR